MKLNKIKSYINKNNLSKITAWKLFDCIDSTNNYLLDEAKKNAKSGIICIAEQQTKGRGQYNRTWLSPKGSNIYLSLLWQFSQKNTDPSGLSLSIAIAVIHALKKYGIKKDLHVKWPNDILFKNKKLAGILIETCQNTRQVPQIIIGIGLNINMPKEILKKLNDQATDIKTITNSQNPIIPESESCELIRNPLTGLLINEILSTLSLFESQQLKPFLQEWYRHDALLNKKITLKTEKKLIHGTVLGITDKGKLILKTENGKTKYLASGSIKR